MKKFLLAGLAGSVALAAAAAAPGPVKKAVDTSAQQVSVQNEMRVLKSKTLAKGVKMNVVADKNGNVSKRIELASSKSRINPVRDTPARELSGGYVLNENFEGYTEDPDNTAWLPAGWTLNRNSGREEALPWSVVPDVSALLIGGFDGAAMAINFDPEYLDEWLVTPIVEVQPGMELSFKVLNDGVWYFSMENVDWETMQYVGDKIVAFDHKINISTDGGQTWTLLKSLADDFMDMDFETLLSASDATAKTIKLSLDEYAGQNVMIGFQYVGKDGNTVAIDDVTVGLPNLELSYANPTGTYFYGMSPNAYSLKLSILNAPVFHPVTWVNLSDNEGATYSWDFFDSDNEWKNSDEQDELTLSFRTDYSSDFSTRNNLYYTPVLHGSAPNSSPGEYTRGNYVQAGNDAIFEIQYEDGDKFLEPFGMGMIDPSAEGTTTISDELVPIFGYSGDSDNYWTRYTFGDEGNDDNWAHLESYMTYFFPSESPLVIRGAWASAFGVIGDEANFKAEIVPLNEDGTLGDPIASASCKGSEVTKIETQGSSDFLTLNFTFAEPVVMSNSVCDAFVVRISGFRDSENVEFFTPVLSENPNPDGMALGWIGKQISFDGDVRESLTPVVNYTETMQTFYIQLDAAFPWLQGEADGTVAQGSTSEVALDSYHPGENLTVDNLPSWLTANVSGRYGETKLNVTAAEDAPEDENVTITVKGAGVSHDVVITVEKGSGIIDIDSVDADETVAIYTLQGVRVSSADAPGLYIVRTADGKAHKAIKK